MGPCATSLGFLAILTLTAIMSGAIYYCTTSPESSGLRQDEEADGSGQMENQTTREFLQNQAESLGYDAEFSLGLGDNCDPVHVFTDPLEPIVNLTHKATAKDILHVSQQLWNLDYDRMKKGTDIGVHFPPHGRFFEYVNPTKLKWTIYSTMQSLMTNTYNPDLSKPDPTGMGSKESAFMSEVNKAQLITKLYDFLRKYGMTAQPSEKEFKSYLKKLWFTKYSRRREDPVNSCGFEHVFVGEYREISMCGMHNWVRLYQAEQAGSVTFPSASYDKIIAGAGYNLRIAWKWKGINRSKYSSFFLRTSPAYELAVYTLCHLYRGRDANLPCTIFTTGTNKVNIKTFVQSVNGFQAIGSAYPEG